MKVIIAGGRDFTRARDDAGNLLEEGTHIEQQELAFKVLYPYSDTASEVVCGLARGADKVGSTFADSFLIEVAKFPADWDKHGRSAGFIRNVQMAKYADVLVAFWDGKSKGTHHMIGTALDHGLEVHVYRY